MTNSSLRYALSAALAAVLAGCDSGDGVKELESARSAYEARDLRKAALQLEKSLSIAPGSVDALVLTARVRLDLGDISGARQAVNDLAESAGGDGDVRMLDAQIAYHEKDYQRSVSVFSGIADDDSLPLDVRSRGMSGAGVVEMTRGEHDAARLSFLKAIRLDRRNPAAWYHLGLLYRDAFGFNEAALEQFEIFVRLEKEADLRVQKVQRSVIPEIKSAIAAHAADRPGAAKRDSAAAAAAIAKAEDAWRKRQYKTARQHYQEAYSADPFSFPAAKGLAAAWETTDASEAGLKKAFELRQVMCELRPDLVSVHIEAAALAMKLSRYMTAVKLYSRAMAADPASLPAIDGLISALRKTGGQAKTASAYQAYRDLIAPRRKAR